MSQFSMLCKCYYNLIKNARFFFLLEDQKTIVGIESETKKRAKTFTFKNFICGRKCTYLLRLNERKLG